jgi:hypothetical protein
MDKFIAALLTAVTLTLFAGACDSTDRSDGKMPNSYNIPGGSEPTVPVAPLDGTDGAASAKGGGSANDAPSEPAYNFGDHVAGSNGAHTISRLPADAPTVPAECQTEDEGTYIEHEDGAVEIVESGCVLDAETRVWRHLDR